MTERAINFTGPVAVSDEPPREPETREPATFSQQVKAAATVSQIWPPPSEWHDTELAAIYRAWTEVYRQHHGRRERQGAEPAGQREWAAAINRKRVAIAEVSRTGPVACRKFYRASGQGGLTRCICGRDLMDHADSVRADWRERTRTRWP